MTKILIGSDDITKEIKNFQFLKNKNEFEIITSNSGIETIEKCKDFNPTIIILYSNFSDIPYNEVINRIANLPSQFDKCNLILNVKSPKDKQLLSNTSIIYRIFDTPFNEKEYQETINVLRNKFEFHKLTLKELKTILLNLRINIYSTGAQYLISTIFKCYYKPEEFITLNNVFNLVAMEFNVSKDQVKNSIRHTIDSFNNTDDKNNYLRLEIFKNNYVSTKLFIENLVNYLHIKNKS